MIHINGKDICIKGKGSVIVSEAVAIIKAVYDFTIIEAELSNKEVKMFKKNLLAEIKEELERERKIKIVEEVNENE